ncbi:unnamed protein product [Schistosoma rodhaini]|uniref:IF rod domain-containing protein n=1 Tax=Schistosoma rodhaini TaxID=6188 RepID=A0AA85F114_9TREM|nr:unnamed protein product [Schistosoma rodhaini]
MFHITLPNEYFSPIFVHQNIYSKYHSSIYSLHILIILQGENMEGAARHAQRLAGNFLEDMEAIQKASRERDRRAMSHFETNSVENSMPRVIHTSYSRNFPLHTSRLGSVPPSAVGTYRSTITSTDYGLPPVVHRNYRTNRYIYETPYHTTTYSNIEPIRTTYTSVGPRRYTYYYPSIVTTRPLSSSGSYSNLSSDMQAERRRIERRMDDLLEYKLPSPEYYREMRGSLRALNDKLDVHRKMLDRYSGIDMNATTASVQDRIESKYQQLASRMGRRTTAMGRD